MPWSAGDAERHTKKAKTPAQKRQWAHVANSALSGGDDEGSAIQQANAVVRDQPSKKKENAFDRAITAVVNEEEKVPLPTTLKGRKHFVKQVNAIRKKFSLVGQKPPQEFERQVRAVLQKLKEASSVDLQRVGPMPKDAAEKLAKRDWGYEPRVQQIGSGWYVWLHPEDAAKAKGGST